MPEIKTSRDVINIISTKQDHGQIPAVYDLPHGDRDTNVGRATMILDEVLAGRDPAIVSASRYFYVEERNRIPLKRLIKAIANTRRAPSEEIHG